MFTDLTPAIGCIKADLILPSSIMNTKPDIYADNPICSLAYMIAVLQAAEAGNQVQFRSFRIGVNTSSWNLLPPLGGYDWTRFQYRISPDSRPKKTVPMDSGDYPAFFWLRWNGVQGAGTAVMPLVIKDRGMILPIPNSQIVTFWDLGKNHYQYSVDRKTWLPCTKEVAA